MRHQDRMKCVHMKETNCEISDQQGERQFYNFPARKIKKQIHAKNLEIK